MLKTHKKSGSDVCRALIGRNACRSGWPNRPGTTLLWGIVTFVRDFTLLVDFPTFLEIRGLTHRPISGIMPVVILVCAFKGENALQPSLRRGFCCAGGGVRLLIRESVISGKSGLRLREQANVPYRFFFVFGVLLSGYAHWGND